MNYLDLMRKFVSYSDEELVKHYFDALGMDDDEIGVYLKACMDSMVQRFVNSVIYFSESEGRDWYGNSNDD